MIIKKIKEFLEKSKKQKEELIDSILRLVKDDEKDTFKKNDLERLNLDELKEIKRILEKY